MSKQQEQEILDDLLSGQWSAKQMVESGVLTPEEAVQRGEEAVAEATAKINKLLIEAIIKSYTNVLVACEDNEHTKESIAELMKASIKSQEKRLTTLQAKEVDKQ